MQVPVLEVRQLLKKFDTVLAVNGISFTLRRGMVFGLLGPNGAGKTTTIRTILHILQPDGGTILYNGKPFQSQFWNIIGYLPEERGLYRKSRVLDTVLYFAGLKNLKGKEARRSAHYWLEKFGLHRDIHRKVEELSKGNQQKVQLVIALLHRPQILVLDEPFTGLDPINQQMLKDVLVELRQQNMAIIFSTHQMEQAEKLCDAILVVNKGKEVLHGTLADIKGRYGRNSVRIEYEGDASFLSSLPIVRKADIYQRYAEIELAEISQIRELLQTLATSLLVRKFEIVEPSLHSIFLDVVGNEGKISGERL